MTLGFAFWMALAILSPRWSLVRADDDILAILSGASDSSSVSELETHKRNSFPRELLQSPTAEQNVLIRFFEQGNYEKSLYQYPVALDGTEFAKSPSGRAFHAWILFQNGIAISALENLLGIDAPERIHKDFIKLWKESAPVSHPAWDTVLISRWNPYWTEVFGVAAEVRVRARQTYGPDQLKVITELLKKTQLNTRERAWLEWQAVLALALESDGAAAAKALAHLMKSKNNPVSEDLMTLTAARLLYQNGFLDAAIQYYGKLPKTSDYWFEAQEEMGWAYLRKGEPQNAMALTKTLMTPAFQNLVGPETAFLQALAQLKVCDYPQVVGTLEQFKDRFRGRAKTLLEITEDPHASAVATLIDRMEKGPVAPTSLGPDGAKLPRYVTRDESLAQLVRTARDHRLEAKRAGELYARSLSGGTSHVGFQGRLETFRKDIESRAKTAQSAILNRVRELAKDEVDEIGQILQKLHIVEAEVLQQITLAKRVSDASQTTTPTRLEGVFGSLGKDRIWFPADEEVWFDELAHYKVDIKKGCESIQR